MLKTSSSSADPICAKTAQMDKLENTSEAFGKKLGSVTVDNQHKPFSVVLKSSGIVQGCGTGAQIKKSERALSEAGAQFKI